MIPAMVFEVHSETPAVAAQTGTVAFSFPGPDPKEAGDQELADVGSGGPIVVIG